MSWLKSFFVALSVVLCAATASAQNEPPARTMSVGLAGVNDWSTQQPFLNIMKTARPWMGHLPRQFGGATHQDLEDAGYLDDHGWPIEKPPELGSIGTMLLTDLPSEATSLAGTYVLRFDGNGILELGGRAQNVRYKKNLITFDFTPGPGGVDLRIQRTDRARKGDHIRNITIVKEEHIAAFDAGAVFNPLWLDRLMGFRAVRFMDWMLTNDSTQSKWDDRPQVDDYTYTRQGVPLEMMLELANRIGVDAWFNMPHLADDDYVRRFAEMVESQLWPDLRAYVELSNEVWNWQFQQAHWANDQATKRWGQEHRWLQFYAKRASEIADIWADVYGQDSDTRLVRVITTQTGWLGLEADMLNAPLWVAEGGDITPPYTHFDAYAVTGYFGAALGLEDNLPMVQRWLTDSARQADAQAAAQNLTGDARVRYLAQHRYDRALELAEQELRDGRHSGNADGTLIDLLGRMLPYHADVASHHDLDLVMYEGGTHVVGLGPTVNNAVLSDFLIHLNYSEQMGRLYIDLITGWFNLGGVLFNVYTDVYPATKWGSWGTLRHLGDQNPRWDAVEALK